MVAHAKIDKKYFRKYPHQGRASDKPKPEPEPRPVGRVRDYREGYPELVKELRMLGLSLEKIAGLFKKQPHVLESWRTMYPEFGKAWDEGGAFADAHVARSLYHRAIGYSHEAEKITFDTKTGHFARTNFVEKYPPDTNAANIWLTNRQPGLWKNKSATELTGADGEPLIPPSIIIQPVRVVKEQQTIEAEVEQEE